jgi:hypothetical protein
LTEEQRLEFQENLLKTMFQIEDTYFSLATTQNRNCLVICDGGAMDCSAYLPKQDWDKILEKNNLNEVDIRDNRSGKIEEKYQNNNDHKPCQVFPKLYT